MTPKRRLPALLPGLALAAAVAGCASPVRVQGLATGQPEVAAYQLQGNSLSELREQAQRLCPEGAEVLRAAEVRSDALSTGGSRAQRWLALATQTLDPPQRLAQMVVVCQPAPGASLIRITSRPHEPAAVALQAVPIPSHDGAERLPNPSLAPVTGYDE